MSAQDIDIHIPDHLLIAILKRLPSKTLIKSLCVSKSWYSLIANPYFISCHFRHHQIHNSHKPKLFIKLNSESRYSFWRYGEQFPNWSDLCLPPVHHSFVAGSCNGLSCLVDGKRRWVYFWNPSIRKCINIDSSSIPVVTPSTCKRISFGFGFDAFTNDYKVVTISNTEFKLSPSYAELYSLNAGTWRNVVLPDFFQDYYISFVFKASFVRNVIHWVIKRLPMGLKSDDPRRFFVASILTFDVGSENFGELRLPPEILANRSGTSSCLAVIGNSLVVLDARIHFSKDDEIFCIWLMKDYGVEESWIVLYRVQATTPLQNPYFGDKEGDKVYMITSWGGLIIFNAKQQSPSVVNGEIVYFDGQVLRGVSSYTESLVLLDKRHQSQAENMEMEV